MCAACALHAAVQQIMDMDSDFEEYYEEQLQEQLLDQIDEDDVMV